MQILFIQSVDFPGQIRPAQTSTQPVLKLFCRDLDPGGLINAECFSRISLAPVLNQLELPTKEIVQQPHVRLNQDREPPRTNNQIRVHKRDFEVLHHIGNLNGVTVRLNRWQSEIGRTVTVALLDTPTRQWTSTFPPSNLAFSIQSQIGPNWGSRVSIPSSQTPWMSSTLILPSLSSIHNDARRSRGGEQDGFLYSGGGINAHSPTETTWVIPRAWSMYALEAWLLRNDISQFAKRKPRNKRTGLRDIGTVTPC